MEHMKGCRDWPEHPASHLYRQALLPLPGTGRSEMGTRKDAGRWVGLQTKLVLLSTTANNPTTCRRPCPSWAPGSARKADSTSGSQLAIPENLWQTPTASSLLPLLLRMVLSTHLRDILSQVLSTHLRDILSKLGTLQGLSIAPGGKVKLHSSQNWLCFSSSFLPPVPASGALYPWTFFVGVTSQSWSVVTAQTHPLRPG